MENKKENYLEKKPLKKENLKWSVDENDAVTFEVENKGFANRLAQKILKKPKISYIHLDGIGSFAWISADGEKNIIEIGKEVRERFGEMAEPLYERLAEYFSILDNNGFIDWKSE